MTVDGEFGTVDGDEVLLRQALVNLLRNAVEACAEARGGAAHPRRRARGPGRRRAPSHGRRQRARRADPTLREKVFQPFFTTKEHGTGLGLALVQKIVVTHNGRITLSASDDGGAAFQVVLPLVQAD